MSETGERLRWGLIGGGEGSQIGPAHRLGARLDGLFDFVAGALDHRAEEGRAFGRRLGLAPERAYGDWREMLAAETARRDPVDLITIATPNASHFEIARAAPLGAKRGWKSAYPIVQWSGRR